MRKKIWQTSLLQAIALSAYMGIVAYALLNASVLFGSAPNYVGALMFLSLFVISALICGFIVFWQPFLLWNKKKAPEAVQLVACTAGWLLLFFFVLLAVSLR